MKVLCVVVLYKPRTEELRENLQQYINGVTTVLLWQNSNLTEAEKQEICRGFDASKIVFCGERTNDGIPKAVNYAIRYMNKENYDYLLTMDQDSIWHNFDQYVGFVESQPVNCLYGPQVISTLDLKEESKKEQPLSCTEVDHVITSGLMCHRSVIDQIGLYNEDLVIDAVDEEYCYRARKKGIPIKTVNGAYLVQHFGNSEKASFLGRETVVSNYSPFRYYYIARNHVYLLRTDLPNKTEKKYIFINYVRSPIVKCILFEKDKKAKLSAIFRGIRDGLSMNNKKY